MIYTKKELKIIESETEIAKYTIDRIKKIKEDCKSANGNEVEIIIYEYEKKDLAIKIIIK